MDSKARIGGILAIVSGGLGVLGLGWTALMVYFSRAMYSRPLSPFAPALPSEAILVMTVMYTAMGAFFALVGALAIVGGVCALKKRRWGLALAGAIAAAVAFFPTGIAAVIYVSMAQSEFSRTVPGSPEPGGVG